MYLGLAVKQTSPVAGVRRCRLTLNWHVHILGDALTSHRGLNHVNHKVRTSFINQLRRTLKSTSCLQSFMLSIFYEPRFRIISWLLVCLLPVFVIAFYASDNQAPIQDKMAPLNGEWLESKIREQEAVTWESHENIYIDRICKKTASSAKPYLLDSGSLHNTKPLCIPLILE